MAKPKKILLIRHGESEGNADKNVYLHTPDYAVKLTEKGREQATTLGEKIWCDHLGQGGHQGIRFYISTYHRAIQTANIIINEIERRDRCIIWSKKRVIERKFDPRLIEQEWTGRLRPTELDMEQITRERDAYGSFYYRFDGGESCNDVYLRCSSHFDTMWRDFEKESFPEVCAFVGHGMLLRVWLMRFFHMSVDEFEILKNPPNCACIVLKLDDDGKYQLEKPLEKWPTPTHPYQVPI